MFKKLLYLLLSFSFFYSYSQCPTGTIYIRSQADVDYFLTRYPNCTEIPGSIVVETNANSGAINNFNGFRNIRRINGGISFSENSPLLRTLNGFENLTHVGGSITLHDSWMTDISGLRNLAFIGGNLVLTSNHINDFSALNNLTFIGGNLTLSNDSDYCYESNIHLRLTNVPGNLSIRTLGSHNFDLTGFESIRTVGGDLSISNWELTSLQGLSGLQSVVGSFSVNSCLSLQNLNGLTSLTSLGSLSLSGNRLMTDISSLSRITSLRNNLNIIYSLVIEGSQNLNTLHGLHNLTSIKGGLYISGNNVLTSINELSGVDLSEVTELTIQNNQVLSLCQELNVCNYILAAKPNTIRGNATGCNDLTQLTESCNNRWKNRIKGTVKIDYENNGCNIGNDRAMDKIMVKATSGSTLYSTFTNERGEYSMYVPQGDYNVTTTASLNNFNVSPPTANITFTGVGNQQTADFCNVPSQTINDVRITFSPIAVARPGFDAYYIIYYENRGTTVRSGSIVFNFNDGKMDFINANVPVQSQTENVLTWNYANLYPYETKSIIVRFRISQPPTVNLNDFLAFTATINPIATDNTPANNTFSINQRVVNSFDPNDKTVLEGDTILVNNIGNYLNYVVRFQNTGTASAVNIKITDELDAKLDYSTFELVGLSHPGRVQLKNNIAEFVFDNINLPDMVSNEPGSHGYITYRIKPKNTTVKGNTIRNYASIYFDYNAPIITNTVSTYVDADTDNDGVYDSKDNCMNVANTNQSDTDNDGIGDVCDDNIEVSPPYYMGFDTATLDSFWKTYKQSSSVTNTNVSVSNLYDADNNGNTIRLYSSYSGYKSMLISPRLNGLTNNSKISFWILREYSSYNPIEIGFMTDPSNPSTFTRLSYAGGSSTMSLYTLNMTNYQPSYGKNLAIMVYGNTVHIDDFKYDPENLSTDENEFKKFRLYPNPTTEFLNIASESGIDSVSIYDLNGRKLKSEKTSNQKHITLNINNLSKGIYMIEIHSDGARQIERFIKE
ncbi:T9SS type A sorting domain-containing protein [Flavobacterium amniphilum]|uniref:thrombospondin type 3 repeat-containing protein n=1 Tax=Flavobacterium amniphilum TaxID=1834035 RepID=UPI00202A2A4F|nr:T9SS type A sorting domain-containing protein [Flavobacterium amniphilum]MCL9805338.1 T9SS type A sorting domain-containing protein [Flavobacterium amniphilum]